MTSLVKLTAALNQLDDRILEVTASSQPDYSENGRSVSKGTYLQQLMDARARLNELIAQSSGPYEIRSQAVT